MRVESALILVDWDSARRVANLGSAYRRDPVTEIEDAIGLLQDEVASTIGKIESTVRVTWRIYHGWHEGERETPDRVNFGKFLARYKPRNIMSISFGRDFQYGDELLCQSMRSPLRYTHRQRRNDKTGEIENYQKMIDTALTSDLLHAARAKMHEHIFVIGDDDDLLPGIFTAERWGANIDFLRISNNSALPLLRGRAKNFKLRMVAKGCLA